MQSVFMRSGFLSGLATAVLVTPRGESADTISLDLVEEGFEVDAVTADVDAVHRLRSDWIDVVLLDARLKLETVRMLCRAVRRDPLVWSVPIIAVGEPMASELVVAVLAAGADEIVVLPVDRRVLAARIKAVIRRRAASECGCAEDLPRPNVLRCGELVVRPDRYEAFLAGRPLKLTLSEFRLLRLFVSQPERILSREQIMRVLHRDAAEITDRSVDSRVSALRKRLGSAGGCIRTVRGLGYRMTADSAG